MNLIFSFCEILKKFIRINDPNWENENYIYTLSEVQAIILFFQHHLWPVTNGGFCVLVIDRDSLLRNNTSVDIAYLAMLGKDSEVFFVPGVVMILFTHKLHLGEPLG